MLPFDRHSHLSLGAQGGNNGAKGQYVKDTLNLTEGQIVYVYVEGKEKELT